MALDQPGIDPYVQIIYAQEAFAALEKQLGMASRVYRTPIEGELQRERGEFVKIRRPGTFEAQDAPSTPQAIQATFAQLQLAYHREVMFAVTDKDLTFAQPTLIGDHIRPAAVTLADDVDQKLNGLAIEVPWRNTLSATPASGDVIDAFERLFTNKAPMNDGQSHLMVHGTTLKGLLKDPAFNQYQGAGTAGAETQRTGSLGMKFGLEVFPNQNVFSHTQGGVADAVGALTADHAKGAKVIGFDGVTNAGEFKKGDILQIAGDTQQYVFTADVTASGAGVVTNAPIAPALVRAYANDTVVTVLVAASGSTKTENVAFHRNAFGFAMAALPRPTAPGAAVEVISDPITGLTIRLRTWYEGKEGKTYMALDILYGLTVLEHNLALRLRAA